MYRSMMQVFVKRSAQALEFYQNVFDAVLICSYYNEDGTLMHSELDVFGQVIAVSELEKENTVSGNTMMFCLHFGEGKESIVQKIYDSIKDGANIINPLSKCDYSPLMADLIDKFGVRWCIFV
ncbi:VOC family protein [Anaerocolumna sp. AGMB13020]|uniref:VOC family protein n=1 Tax=Anaerocolumna sp. AGMB13020 TaxID=3081750 RepID=UPI0029530064|nr:VOC family protein [Anaerocolumna sp. AGMB13020]WOO36334.1 VOC family protein [Anaerocolumna sp. AGMB13020]